MTCPHAQYYWWGLNTASILGVGANDVLCTTLPLFHINALNTFAQAALLGCSVVFEPQFSASRFWATMRERGATVLYLLGAMVPILLIEQNARAALQVADYGYVLETSETVLEGSAAELLANPRVVETYLGLARA